MPASSNCPHFQNEDTEAQRVQQLTKWHAMRQWKSRGWVSLWSVWDVGKPSAKKSADTAEDRGGEDTFPNLCPVYTHIF